MSKTVLITGAGTGFGRHATVQLAGRGQTGPLASMPMARLRRVFEVNVFGTFAITPRVAAAMKRKRAGRILIVSSIAGVRAGIGSGPYAMTKHALEAMGGVFRNELAAFGIDVALINPGPFATGFNGRMANDPGDWFDRNTAAPEEVAIMASLVKRITVGQIDPADVVERYVELVDADETELVSFIRKDILEHMCKPKPA